MIALISNTNSFYKSISGCKYSNVPLNFDCAILNQNEIHATSKNENTSAGQLAQYVIGRIESLKNTEINSTELSELKTQIRLLTSVCNSKFLNDFPIQIVDMLIGNVHFEIISWYCPNLILTNICEFIINAFEELERNSHNTHVETSNRCIDAMCVLVDYFNVVVPWKTEYKKKN